MKIKVLTRIGLLMILGVGMLMPFFTTRVRQTRFPNTAPIGERACIMVMEKTQAYTELKMI